MDDRKFIVNINNIGINIYNKKYFFELKLNIHSV